MWVKCNLCWCIVGAVGGMPEVHKDGWFRAKQATGGGHMGFGLMVWLKQEDGELIGLSLCTTQSLATDVNVYYFQSACMWMCDVYLCIHACECVCLFRHTRCILAAVVCQCKTSSQSLSIQVELQPEEIHTLPLPALVCHKTLPVTSHALKPCHTLLGTRERIQIGKGKSATPQVIKPAARHLSKLTHAHTPAWTHTSTHIHMRVHMHQNCAQAGTNQDTHIWAHTQSSCVYVCKYRHTQGHQIKGNVNVNDWWWPNYLHTCHSTKLTPQRSTLK